MDDTENSHAVRKRGKTYSRFMKIEIQKNNLKTGHETPVTPPVPPTANSSALPLKSLITFPVLTSKMLMTTL
jgi:hypothetical protein